MYFNFYLGGHCDAAGFTIFEKVRDVLFGNGGGRAAAGSAIWDGRSVEGKLYLQTGSSKSVAQQLKADPKVELCAFDGERWLRVAATAVYDDNIEAQKHMLAAYPSLQAMPYQPGDGNTAVLLPPGRDSDVLLLHGGA